MLRQAVERMKGASEGTAIPFDQQALLSFDFVALTQEELRQVPRGEKETKLLRCGAYIPESYLPEAKLAD